MVRLKSIKNIPAENIAIRERDSSKSPVCQFLTKRKEKMNLTKVI